MGTLQWYLNGEPKSRYEGEFRDGKTHGKGTYIWASGARYEGDWRDGKKHGKGTYVFANGTRVVGDWRDGKLEKRCVSDTECGALSDSAKSSGTLPSSVAAAVQELPKIPTALYDINQLSDYCAYIKLAVNTASKVGGGPAMTKIFSERLVMNVGNISEFEMPRLVAKSDVYVKNCIKTAVTKPIVFEVFGHVTYGKYDFSENKVMVRYTINKPDETFITIPNNVINGWRNQLAAAGIVTKPVYFTQYSSVWGEGVPALTSKITDSFEKMPMTASVAEKLSLAMAKNVFQAKLTIAADRVVFANHLSTMPPYFTYRVVKIQVDSIPGMPEQLWKF